MEANLKHAIVLQLHEQNLFEFSNYYSTLSLDSALLAS